MDPITMAGLALTIAEKTGLTEMLGKLIGGDTGGKVAAKVVDVAQLITGADNPKDVLARIDSDKVAATRIKETLIKQEHELKVLAIEDVKDAREMYRHSRELTNKVADVIMRFNLSAVMLLIACNGLVLYFIENAAAAVAIGNLIGASAASLWEERQQVVRFCFGSSLGSKLKGAASGKN